MTNHEANPIRPRVALDLLAGGLAVLLLLAGSAGCWPGRCDGAFRALFAHGAARGAAGPGAPPASIVPGASFTLNADSQRRSAAELLAASGIGAESYFLEGPGGSRVPATIEAVPITSAHSCASAATFTLRPLAPLTPGDYTLVVLIDATRWPAVYSGDVETFRGRPALVRRYRVP